MAREEGEVNIVQWPNYAQLIDEFTAATGCTVNTKDGASSDDMISLMQTGAYDGISASGNATVRLMTTGEVAPIDTELIPNYADIQEGIKDQVHNSLDGAAVWCSARPRPEPPHVPQRHRPRGHDQLGRDLGGRRLAGLRGEDLDLRRLDLHRGRCRVSEGDAARSRDRQPVPARRGAVQRRGRPAEEAGAQRRRVLAGRRRKQIGVVHEQGQRRRHDVAVSVRPADRGRSARAGRRRSSRPRARRAGRTRGCSPRRPRTRTACTSG